MIETSMYFQNISALLRMCSRIVTIYIKYKLQLFSPVYKVHRMQNSSKQLNFRFYIWFDRARRADYKYHLLFIFDRFWRRNLQNTTHVEKTKKMTILKKNLNFTYFSASNVFQTILFRFSIKNWVYSTDFQLIFLQQSLLWNFTRTS